MRRRALSTGGKIGLALLVAGTASMAWSQILDFSPGSLGRIGVVLGVILICYGKLVTRTAASDQTYRLGYDLGIEAGHREARGAQRPVVVDLERRRVVCSECKAPCSKTAPRVVDRV